MKTLGALAALLLTSALLLTGCAPAPAAEPAGQATELEVHFFQAGKADAILLTTESSAVLVDAGEKGFGKEIVAFLREKGITRLDYLSSPILTRTTWAARPSSCPGSQSTG